jgi:hypothetical protein
MISSMVCSRIRFRPTSGECCVDRTTVWMRATLSPSYSTVTCDLQSGRSHSILPLWRSLACIAVSLCDQAIGAGINSGVSSQA